MSRKKPFERITIQNIEITEAAAEGKALARHDNMVIFVNNAVPGDVCDIQITRNKISCQIIIQPGVNNVRQSGQVNLSSPFYSGRS